MKIQKRKIMLQLGKYRRVTCWDEKHFPHTIQLSIERCVGCKFFFKKDNNIIYCKKVTAPYWAKDRIIEVDGEM